MLTCVLPNIEEVIWIVAERAPLVNVSTLAFENRLVTNDHPELFG